MMNYLINLINKFDKYYLDINYQLANILVIYL
jgi:hypothetical protein